MTTSHQTASPSLTLGHRSLGDRVFKGLLTAAAVSIPVLLGLLVFELYAESREAIDRFTLAVTYDPDKVSTKDILKAIEKMGFKGKLQKTEEKGA